MSSAYHPPHYLTPPGSLWRKFRRRPENVELIPVKQWAQENNYSVSGAIALIRTGRLDGYKSNYRWYVPQGAAVRQSL